MIFYLFTFLAQIPISDFNKVEVVMHLFYQFIVYSYGGQKQKIIVSINNPNSISYRIITFHNHNLDRPANIYAMKTDCIQLPTLFTHD